MPGSRQQPLQTPPSSNTPERTTSSARKRKRHTPFEVLSGSNSKRSRRARETAYASRHINTGKSAAASVVQAPESTQLRANPVSPNSSIQEKKQAESHSSPRPPAGSPQRQSDPPSRDGDSLPEAKITALNVEVSNTEEDTLEATRIATGNENIEDIKQPREPYQKEELKHNDSNPSIAHWILERDWPKEYFTTEHRMGGSLTKKRSSSTLKDGDSEVSSTERNYRSAQFQTLLKSVGILMSPEPSLPPTHTCMDLCTRLLTSEQTLPEDTLFKDEYLARYLGKITEENEAMLFCDITPLLAPRVELLQVRGATHLDFLHGHINKGWVKAKPLLHPHRSQTTA